VPSLHVVPQEVQASVAGPDVGVAAPPVALMPVSDGILK
jgi:hypothetical protein